MKQYNNVVVLVTVVGLGIDKAFGITQKHTLKPLVGTVAKG